MKLLLALALVTASLAFLPMADACAGVNCVPDKDVTVCVDAIPMACQTHNARDFAEKVLRIFEPCTCPPL